jgi:hypothetical protein
MQDAPKCPVHKMPMAAATWLKAPTGPFPKPIHCCSQRNCPYVHDGACGFYKVAEQEPIGHPIPHAVRRMR